MPLMDSLFCLIFLLILFERLKIFEGPFYAVLVVIEDLQVYACDFSVLVVHVIFM